MNTLLQASATRSSRWLHDALEPVQLRARDVIAEVEEHPSHLYFPETGVVSMVGLTSDGRSVELGVIGREGVAGAFAAFGQVRLPYRLMVQVPGRMLRAPAELVRAQLDRDGRLGALLMNHYLPLINTQVSTAAVCNRFHSGRQRLARWLLLTCDRTRRRTIPNSHDMIADMVGGPRSAVSTAVGGLRRDDLISSSRGTIRIEDRDRLEAAACECYESVTSAIHAYLRALRTA